MNSDCQKQVRLVCAQIAFLMEHQEILPDLKEYVSKLDDSDEYLRGAHDALNYLIDFLAQKGNR
jgi:hypothetical protein